MNLANNGTKTEPRPPQKKSRTKIIGGYVRPPEPDELRYFSVNYSEDKQYLYAIGQPSIWKVGITTNVDRRFKQLRAEMKRPLRTGLVQPIHGLGYRYTERYAHFVLNPFNVCGEWFTCTLQDIETAFHEALQYQGRLLKRCEEIKNDYTEYVLGRSA